jgi:hypothetical protein
MRTKTLLLTAALTVATAATSMAQVFSANVVGYVNVVCPVGYSMIANPLKGTNTAIASLFTAPPEGSSVFKFNGSGYVSDSFNDGAWDQGGTLTIAPGEGIFFQNAGATPYTNTFVGEVVLASTNTLPQGYSIRSSVVPQAGLLQTTLLFPPNEGDNIFLFRNGGYVGSGFNDGSWDGAGEPNVNVGEAYFVQKSVSNNWVRIFNPNTP